MNDLELERLRQVAEASASPSPRDDLILAVDFIARVTNHASHLESRDTTQLGLLFVEKLDAYLALRERAKAHG